MVPLPNPSLKPEDCRCPVAGGANLGGALTKKNTFCALKQPFLAQKGPETESKLTNKGKRSVHYTCALIAS